MSRRSQKLLLGLIVLFSGCSLIASQTTVASETNGVRSERITRLAKGINIPGWFWLNRGPVGELEKRYPDADFELIAKLGLTHVRIPIDMANVYDKNQPDLLNKTNLPYLDRGIRKILSHQLAIIIDLHSISQKEGGSNYSGPLGRDETFTETFCLFWTSFARHVIRFDPDWVILEPMNEPVLSGKEEPVFKTLDSLKEYEAAGVLYKQRNIVTSGNIVTADGPAAAREFGRTIVQMLMS